MQKIKDFITECKRVLLITKKPDQFELKAIVKVSSLGILLIGAIGFLVQLIEILLLK
ncbi:protein translocase SEC61 complex subunit gamma [Candidatus Woesearchaeota archaeon]|nr:protein translocase SEC61 complex subunit gamma [Candidatus Woesearchaeota archaeon]